MPVYEQYLPLGCAWVYSLLQGQWLHSKLLKWNVGLFRFPQIIPLNKKCIHFFGSTSFVGWLLHHSVIQHAFRVWILNLEPKCHSGLACLLALFIQCTLMYTVYIMHVTSGVFSTYSMFVCEVIGELGNGLIWKLGEREFGMCKWLADTPNVLLHVKKHNSIWNCLHFSRRKATCKVTIFHTYMSRF